MRFTEVSDQAKLMVVGGAAVSMTTAAQGAIIHFNPADYTISGRTPVSAYLDIQGGTISGTNQPGLTDLVVTTGATDDQKPYAHVSAVAGSLEVLAAGNGDAETWTTARTVGSANSFATTPEMEMLADNDFYIGFRLNPSTTPLYGWALINLIQGFSGISPTDENSYDIVTIKEWAYEDTGASITTPAIVPEASTSAMMAVLAGSAALYRRRERKTAAA